MALSLNAANVPQNESRLSVNVRGVTTQRPLRIDAARNAELLVRAAWEAFTESGPDVSLDEVARRAGVGVATLYRRFPSKDDLLAAIMEWRYAESLEPVLVRAVADEDPWRAMVMALEAALTEAELGQNVIKASREPGAMLSSVKTRYLIELMTIVRRAQEHGKVRADLDTDDIRMVFLMLVGCMKLDVRGAINWRRGLSMMLDGLRPAAATPLPPG